ncbi:MAG: hypothetical protein HY870_02935 [Chloroflexi bacterium]|nr:hypothetical protein [Chloroflexota bacterium]
MRNALVAIILLTSLTSACNSAATFASPPASADQSGWTLAYAHDAQGVRTDGDLEALISAVTTGRAVRIVTGGPQEYYSTDAGNLWVRNGIVYAQNASSVSVEYHDDLLLFKEDSYYWMIIVSTRGDRDSIRWDVGAHVPRGHTRDRVAVRWFVR